MLKKVVIHILIVAILTFVQFRIINYLTNAKESWAEKSNEDNFAQIELTDFSVEYTGGPKSGYPICKIVEENYKYSFSGKYMPRTKRGVYLEQLKNEEKLYIIYVPSKDLDTKTLRIVELRSDDIVYVSAEEVIKDFRSEWVNARIGFAFWELLYLAVVVVYIVTAILLR